MHTAIIPVYPFEQETVLRAIAVIPETALLRAKLKCLHALETDLSGLKRACFLPGFEATSLQLCPRQGKAESIAM